MLANRVANLAPIDDLSVAISAVTAYTQTIGIYPDELIPKIRNQLAFAGAQRLITLGYVAPSRWLAPASVTVRPVSRASLRHAERPLASFIDSPSVGTTAEM